MNAHLPSNNVATGYFADYRKGGNARGKVHAVDAAERPVCGAQPSGQYHYVSGTGGYIECSKCLNALLKQDEQARARTVYAVETHTTRGDETTVEADERHRYRKQADAQKAAKRLAQTFALINRGRKPRQVTPDRYMVQSVDMHGAYSVAFVVTPRLADPAQAKPAEVEKYD